MSADFKELIDHWEQALHHPWDGQDVEEVQKTIDVLLWLQSHRVLPLLFEVSAFLSMLTRGLFPTAAQMKREADELLEKLGKAITDAGPPE